ncbi:MAG: DMT family transporter [Fusobacteriaceae bacterium]|jgi:drug/metabolite transporter (DMT)-like permease|nr:DMT family transporter [Fusobacteriaceae bacterium]
MTKLQIRNHFLLFAAALIWGSAFVAQRVAVDYMEPNTFTGLRSLIAAVFLIPVIFIADRFKNGPEACAGEVSGRFDRQVLTGGALCGVILFAGSIFQQIGIQYTTPGKAGFITALYIVGVPVFGIFLKKKSGPFLWIGVLFAVAGLYLLCITSGFALGRGDGWLLLCAVIYTFHILVIDHYIRKADGLRMSCVQLFVCALCASFFMILTEHPDPRMILAGWKPLLYAAILSSGVAYTFQIVGQREVNPTVASLILSLESVFAVISGAIVLGQHMTTRETTGCALMFAAIILAQIPRRS